MATKVKNHDFVVVSPLVKNNAETTRITTSLAPKKLKLFAKILGYILHNFRCFRLEGKDRKRRETTETTGIYELEKYFTNILKKSLFFAKNWFIVF